jgi:hypothetical protein
MTINTISRLDDHHDNVNDGGLPGRVVKKEEVILGKRNGDIGIDSDLGVVKLLL